MLWYSSINTLNVGDLSNLVDRSFLNESPGDDTLNLKQIFEVIYLY